ncbi:MAG: beta-ketoacyl-[Oscillospiraceae bacterium]|nr:beta-ketoacyl-[acyl-carrier-protein] synthase family protein [Oscillospiraceae bacterium]
MNRKRIVITGMGAVTPVGVGVPAYWRGVTTGQCGIGEITGLETYGLPIKFAARVTDFNPRDFLPTKLVQDLEQYMYFAYVSAEEAVKQSGLNAFGVRTGIIMGTALSGVSMVGETGLKAALGGKTAGPKFLTKAMGNIAAAQFAISHKIQGPCMTVSTACSSGGDAVMIASMLIRSGAADAVIVMAGEAAICPPIIRSLARTGALSKTGESRPFDRFRNGFVMGEGGGALVLESEERANARGAKIIAEVLGCANTNDAYNPVSPEPDGMGAARCIKLSLEDAGLSPDQIDYVNAHGTSTAVGDLAESKAIRWVYGGRPVFVSSTKGSTGHMMGAGGVTEIIACVKAIETGLMPVNTGMREQDDRCGLNIVTKDNQVQKVDIAMSDAFGFGGQNSCVIVGRYEARE